MAQYTGLHRWHSVRDYTYGTVYGTTQMAQCTGLHRWHSVRDYADGTVYGAIPMAQCTDLYRWHSVRIYTDGTVYGTTPITHYTYLYWKHSARNYVDNTIRNSSDETVQNNTRRSVRTYTDSLVYVLDRYWISILNCMASHPLDPVSDPQLIWPDAGENLWTMQAKHVFISMEELRISIRYPLFSLHYCSASHTVCTGSHVAHHFYLRGMGLSYGS